MTEKKLRKSVSLVANAVYNTNRLFKIASYLVEEKLENKIQIIGFWEANLPIRELYNSNIDIYRIKNIKQYFPNITSSIISKFLVAISLIPLFISFVISTVRNKPVSIFCHDVMMLPVAIIAKWIVGSKIYYLPHELETEEDGLGRTRRLLLKKIESFCIKYVSYTVTVSDRIAIWYSDEYKLKKIGVIRNIPKFDFTCNQKKLLRKRLGINENEIIFLYQGLLDVSRGILSVIYAFERIISTGKHLVFMGYGPAIPYIIEKSLCLSNIHYLPAVSAKEIFSYTSDADIGVTFIEGNYLSLSYRYSLSNKYFEYLKSCIPILVSKNLESISAEVMENEIGWVVESNMKGLENFMLKLSKEDIEFKKQQLLIVARNYSWEKEVKLLNEIYAE